MTFAEYQKESRRTAAYANAGKNYIYPTLGLAGEGGEVANQIKKIERDDHGVVTDARKKAIAHELGDVLWYVAQVATEFGLSLDDVASENLQKLLSRLDRGTINGDGDTR